MGLLDAEKIDGLEGDGCGVLIPLDELCLMLGSEGLLCGIGQGVGDAEQGIAALAGLGYGEGGDGYGATRVPFSQLEKMKSKGRRKKRGVYLQLPGCGGLFQPEGRGGMLVVWVFLQVLSDVGSVRIGEGFLQAHLLDDGGPLAMVDGREQVFAAFFWRCF